MLRLLAKQYGTFILARPSTLEASGLEITQVSQLYGIAIIIGLKHSSRSLSVHFELTVLMPVSSRHHDGFRL